MVLSPLRNRGSAIKNGLTHHAQSPSKYALFSYDSKRLSAAAVLPTQGDPVMIINFCLGHLYLRRHTEYKQFRSSKQLDKFPSLFTRIINQKACRNSSLSQHAFYTLFIDRNSAGYSRRIKAPVMAAILGPRLECALPLTHPPASPAEHPPARSRTPSAPICTRPTYGRAAAPRVPRS